MDYSKRVPLLSIIVPTKNRAQYAGPCVRSLLRSEASDLEVVLQDNSDGHQTRSAVEALLDDSRLTYRHSSEPMSMHDNFAKGLELASGEYVAFVGDDDGINPELINAVRWAKAEGLDALVGCSAAHYYWPDVTFALYGKRLSSALLLGPFSGRVTYPDAEEELLKCVRSAGAGFGRLPKAYHGVVKQGFLDQISRTAGTHFPGPTPDMATAVALGCLLKRFAHIDYPLFISGTGRGSGGGAGTEKKHDWSLESVPWFSRRALRLWSDVVPRYCCGTTLWSEDVIQATKAMGRGDVLRYFNAERLYARCVVYHRRHNSQTFTTFGNLLRSGRSNTFLPAVSFAYYYASTWMGRLASLVSNVLVILGVSRTRRISSIINIDQASIELQVALQNAGCRFGEQLGCGTAVPQGRLSSPPGEP
jgi:glycosyltransferase involved in cell wall biosynthesis